VSQGNLNGAAAKLAALAYAELSRGRKSAATDAIEKALANAERAGTRFLAARLLVDAGDTAKARTEAAQLSLGTFESPAEPEAYAKILEGRIALEDGDVRQAIKLLTEANTLLDTWIGHYDLGRTYLEAGAFAKADAEFDTCIARRGETLALLLNEQPTYGYFPIVHYYQGLARERLQNAGSADSYRKYLEFRGKSTEDLFVGEIGRRRSQ